MITKKHTAIVALAVCTLALSTLGSAKHPVARPFTSQDTLTWVVSLADGSSQAQGSGVATHTGPYLNLASGYWNLGTFTLVSASGVATADNGDQIFWKLPGSSFTVEWTGGTGRFQNASGGFNVVAQSEPVVAEGPVPGTITITVTFTSKGTLTY